MSDIAFAALHTEIRDIKNKLSSVVELYESEKRDFTKVQVRLPHPPCLYRWASTASFGSCNACILCILSMLLRVPRAFGFCFVLNQHLRLGPPAGPHEGLQRRCACPLLSCYLEFHYGGHISFFSMEGSYFLVFAGGWQLCQI